MLTVENCVSLINKNVSLNRAEHKQTLKIFLQKNDVSRKTFRVSKQIPFL